MVGDGLRGRRANKVLRVGALHVVPSAGYNVEPRLVAKCLEITRLSMPTLGGVVHDRPTPCLLELHQAVGDSILSLLVA